MINELAKEIHENAKDKGFFDNKKNIGEMLCLIHSEVSEALEADRVDKRCRVKEYIEGYSHQENLQQKKEGFELHVKNSFEDELADIMIRVMDLAAYKNIDLEKHIELKMEYNSLREHKHGKRY